MEKVDKMINNNFYHSLLQLTTIYTWVDMDLNNI